MAPSAISFYGRHSVYVLDDLKGSSYGLIALTVQLSSMAVFPLVNMMALINTLKSSQAIYDKITTQITDGGGKSRKNKFTLKDKIEVKDLNFQYEDTKILHDASFTLEKGKKYLLKGPSGSGKSTIMKLLSGIYDDYTGSITIDGKELRTIDNKSFYDKAAFIYQDVFLFEASLKENIALFKQINEKQLNHAITVAGLTEFVDKNPEKADLFIEENGKNLSGGERQRVAIARAMYKDAEILFIDEATSSLNDEIARNIEKTILGLDQTVIEISHKFYPGITNRYDYVIEVKNGFVTTYPIRDYFPEVHDEA
jgi:ABC-type multidrug transport system fused ATPase/permease subunit